MAVCHVVSRTGVRGRHNRGFAGGSVRAEPAATVMAEMVASEPMKLRAILLTVVKVSATGVALGATACGGSPGKMVVDVSTLPYQAPDISEITGIEEPDSDGEAGGSAQPGK